MINANSVPAPKVFISYSWSSEEHQEWVLKLAAELRESGVDVILDKWDLREGQDAHAFMEKMVADPEVSRVLLICDAVYVEKANARAGGVGTEAQIISPAIYGKIQQKKFVAVARERDASGYALVPTYYGSRIYIDMTSEEVYASNFEQLVRWIFDRPIHVKPAIGNPPAFFEDPSSPRFSNSALQRKTLDAIKNQKPNSRGLIADYFESCTKELEIFRIGGGADPFFDDKVVASIDGFKPHRSEILEILAALMRYDRSTEVIGEVHRLFEGMLPFYDVTEGMTSYSDWNFDNFKFIVHELFLYTIAMALKCDQFTLVETLLSSPYYLPRNPRGGGKSTTFVEFRKHLDSLDSRNSRLKLNLASLRAVMLRDRNTGSGLHFSQLMQADFVLFLRSNVDLLKSTDDKQWKQPWWPETLFFSGRFEGACEIFSRAESMRYFNRIKGLIGIVDKNDLGAVLEAFTAKRLHVPAWNFERVNPAEMLGFMKIATKP